MATTPPKSSTPLQAPDTVPFYRETSQSRYRTGDLNRGRQAVLNDLGWLLQVPFDRLATRIGASVPQDSEIAIIRKELVEQGIVTQTGWKGFDVEPTKSKRGEGLTFNPLVDIINGILEQQPNCVVDYQEGPSDTPNSDRHNTSRPDGYLKLRKTKTGKLPNDDAIHWFDIAVPTEYKKNNTESDFRDNASKMIWSLHNIMREDPCRRFAFGLTIENTELRLWLSNRSLLVLTEPIDLLKEIDKVISLFYTFGSLSEVELGWDDTVERIEVLVNQKKEFRYRFQVRNKMDGGTIETFTTTRPLATYGADSLVGRGTRVYEAVDATGKQVAIKDSWRDHDRRKEGDILQDILKDVREEFGEEALKYFVGLRAYGDVFISDTPDSTLDHLVGVGNDGHSKWLPISAGDALSSKLHLPARGHIPSSQPCRAPGVTRRIQETPPLDPGRTHTRTVFRDVGEALHDMTELSDIMSCLLNTCQALEYMHKLGWVHRDFSVGNALWVRDSNIGKLSDFEYAKKITDETKHDIRTGTMHFMAVEVEHGSYLFHPPNWDVEWEKKNVGSDATVPSVRMNFLHDLESVWWAFVWIILYHTEKASPTHSPDAQWGGFAKVFDSRPKFLRNSTSFPHHTLSEGCKPFRPHIVALGRVLVMAYTKAEEPFPILDLGLALQEDIHSKFKIHLSAAHGVASGIVLRRLPEYCYELKRLRAGSSPESPTTAKRPRTLNLQGL